jgi:hypothetical protein
VAQIKEDKQRCLQQKTKSKPKQKQKPSQKQSPRKLPRQQRSQALQQVALTSQLECLSDHEALLRQPRTFHPSLQVKPRSRRQLEANALDRPLPKPSDFAKYLLDLGNTASQDPAHDSFCLNMLRAIRDQASTTALAMTTSRMFLSSWESSQRWLPEATGKREDG